MSLGEDVRVDAESEAGNFVEGLGAGGEEMEFTFGLDVEEEDVGVEGGIDLPDLFTNSGKDDFFECRLVSLTNALELAAGDDVEACALFRQETEDCQRGVGFDGVADSVRTGFGAMRKGAFEELETLRDLFRRVDVEGR